MNDTSEESQQEADKSGASSQTTEGNSDVVGAVLSDQDSRYAFQSSVDIDSEARFRFPRRIDGEDFADIFQENQELNNRVRQLEKLNTSIRESTSHEICLLKTQLEKVRSRVRGSRGSSILQGKAPAPGSKPWGTIRAASYLMHHHEVAEEEPAAEPEAKHNDDMEVFEEIERLRTKVDEQMKEQAALEKKLREATMAAERFRVELEETHEQAKRFELELETLSQAVMTMEANNSELLQDRTQLREENNQLSEELSITRGRSQFNSTMGSYSSYDAQLDLSPKDSLLAQLDFAHDSGSEARWPEDGGPPTPSPPASARASPREPPPSAAVPNEAPPTEAAGVQASPRLVAGRPGGQLALSRAADSKDGLQPPMLSPPASARDSPREPGPTEAAHSKASSSRQARPAEGEARAQDGLRPPTLSPPASARASPREPEPKEAAHGRASPSRQAPHAEGAARAQAQPGVAAPLHPLGATGEAPINKHEETLENEVLRLKQENSRLASQVEKLSRELQEERSRHAELEEAWQAERRRNEASQDQLAALGQQTAELSGQLSGQLKNLQHSERHRRESIVAAVEATQTLRQVRSELSRSQAVALEEKQKYQDQLRRRTEKIEDLKKTLATMAKQQEEMLRAAQTPWWQRVSGLMCTTSRAGVEPVSDSMDTTDVTPRPRGLRLHMPPAPS